MKSFGVALTHIHIVIIFWIFLSKFSHEDGIYFMSCQTTLLKITACDCRMLSGFIIEMHLYAWFLWGCDVSIHFVMPPRQCCCQLQSLWNTWFLRLKMCVHTKQTSCFVTHIQTFAWQKTCMVIFIQISLLEFHLAHFVESDYNALKWHSTKIAEIQTS